MVKTIGNPLSWTAQGLLAGGSAMADGVAQIGGTDHAPPTLYPIHRADIRSALRKGLADAMAFRTDVAFVVLLYPFIGVCLAVFASHMAALPLLFPVIAGFALVGPLAAVGLYQMSRDREAGRAVSWRNAFDVLHSPSLVPLVLLGVALLAVFFLWIGAAAVIYDMTLGPEPPVSLGAFASDVFGTAAGWTMIVLGIGVGFLFALLVLSVSLISFPLLLDRPVGLVAAVVTSAQVVRRNPATALTWGAIVAMALGLGMLPVFLGLILVMPVLGHATWHLYRAATTPEADR